MVSIYVNYISQPSRAVLVFCRMVNINFNTIQVDLRNKNHLKTDFMDVNQFGMVPVLVEKGNQDLQDRTIIESGSILRYLADTRKVDEHWFPRSNYLKRAKVDSMLDWAGTQVRPPLTSYLQQTAYRKFLGIRPASEERISLITRDFNKTMKQLEAILEENQYI